MQAIQFSTRGQDRLALSRSAILCTSKGKPSSGVSRSEGLQQVTQQGVREFAPLGTDATTFATACKLKADLNAAAAVRQPDLQTCALLWDQWRSAESSLSPSAMAYRNAIDLAKLERDEHAKRAQEAYAEAEYQAKRSGTGPADKAWETFLAARQQAWETYAAAVAEAKAKYAVDAEQHAKPQRRPGAWDAGRPVKANVKRGAA